jgi:hypothetical protein
VKSPPRLADWRWSRALVVITAVGSFSVAAAEIAARVDDLVERQIPLLANPTYESELRIRQDGILQGRPHGHYKKWKLNAWGFRSPEIAFEKRPDCARVLVLGASDMFGLYESPGKDFSAILLARLTSRGCYEVINAAMAGLGLGSARIYWDKKLAAFRPDLVLIYPNPIMNITDTAPVAPPAGSPARAPSRKPAAAEATAPQSRLLDRLREFMHTPAVIDDWRIRHALAAQLRAHPADWVQNQPPLAGLASFTAQLEALVADIEASGAQVILMTIAGRITPETLAKYPHDALWVQADVPNVTPAAQLAFTALANERMRTMAKTRKLPLVDLDVLLSGCRECFVDPAHFTDRGAELAASAAATAIPRNQLDTVIDRAARGSSK